MQRNSDFLAQQIPRGEKTPVHLYGIHAVLHGIDMRRPRRVPHHLGTPIGSKTDCFPPLIRRDGDILPVCDSGGKGPVHHVELTAAVA